MLVEVGLFDALPENDPVAIVVEGRGLVLIRRGPRVYALRDICPHQTQSFVDGNVHRRLVSKRAGTLAVSDEIVLACPWHHWEFSVATGRCTVDPRFRVRAYPVTIEDGRVYVETEASRDEMTDSARSGRAGG